VAALVVRIKSNDDLLLLSCAYFTLAWDAVKNARAIEVLRTCEVGSNLTISLNKTTCCT